MAAARWCARSLTRRAPACRLSSRRSRSARRERVAYIAPAASSRTRKRARNHATTCLQAWRKYDAKYKVSCRRFVRPSFNEVRHVLNLSQERRRGCCPPVRTRARIVPDTHAAAQVLAMRDTNLRLVTFDGDCTLYSDGNNFSDRK